MAQLPSTARSGVQGLPHGGPQRAVRPDTARLTAGIARGDRAAFAAFYDAWFDRALGLAKRTLRADEEQSLDVVQDVMLRVARSMPRLSDERAVASWMARTVHSVAIDRLRADARRARHERNAAPADVTTGTEPQAQLELEERARWLRARLDELPEVDRNAVRLRFEGDRTLEAVGEILGISGHAAHGRIRRSLARLRELAREVFGDGNH